MAFSAGLPSCPPALKAIQHYVKTAGEHEDRDPVVTYYCYLYALQKGMQIDMKSPDCAHFLGTLMDVLEKIKATYKDNEAIKSEIVGQAHIESCALKLFLYADNEDRAARYNKNVVKSFYAAGILFDILDTFGPISEDLESNKKYAKWKAAYIHKCLKEGSQPVPGPMQEDGAPSDRPAGWPIVPQPGGSGVTPGSISPSNHMGIPPTHAPPSTPADPPPSSSQWQPPPNPAGVNLTAADYQRAMKLCKHASSALQYEDSASAIENLTKALNLVTTGHE